MSVLWSCTFDNMSDGITLPVLTFINGAEFCVMAGIVAALFLLLGALLLALGKIVPRRSCLVNLSCCERLGRNCSRASGSNFSSASELDDSLDLKLTNLER